MKKIIGKPLNITSDIIGKVTFNFSPYNNEAILVSKKVPKITLNYKAIITCASNVSKEGKFPIIYDVKDINGFKKGDIVFINHKGEITFLYEKESDDNYILLTNKCNCKCKICPQIETENIHDLKDINIKLISLIDKKTKYLGITGGEPTLAKNELLEIIKISKEKQPYSSLELLTNGILLEDLNFVKELVSIKHPNLIFQIPLYSDIDFIHNELVGIDGFYKTINGLYNLALFKQRIEIRTVILTLNYERLVDFAEFIYRNFPFIYHIAFMGMECTGRAKENIRDYWVIPVNYTNQLKYAIQFFYRADMNVSIYNHQLCLLPKVLWPFTRKSISLWKRSYFDTCSACLVKSDCGGFFSSLSKDLFNNCIKAISLQ